MLIYHYDKDSKIYLGKEEADESPLEPGVFLLPQYTTFIEPTFKEGYTSIWADGVWVHSATSDLYPNDAQQNLLNKFKSEYENKLKSFRWRSHSFVINIDFRLTLSETNDFFRTNPNGSAVIDGIILKEDDFRALYKEYLLFKNDLDVWQFETEKTINNFSTKDK